MKIALAGLAAATLAACGSGATKATAPSSSPPSASTSAAPSPSLDNYAQIACTDIDKARTKVTGSLPDRVDAIHAYQDAVLAAMKSPDPDVKAKGQAGLVPVDQLGAGQLENRLDDWRSFCESKGWVGTP